MNRPTHRSDTGHELLSIMDAYSPYNQYQMDPIDEEWMALYMHDSIYYCKVMPFAVKYTREIG